MRMRTEKETRAWERRKACPECNAQPGQPCRWTKAGCELNMPALRRAFPERSEEALCICSRPMMHVHQARSWSDR